MKLGIMQPYFFPYIGYWQLMNAVDKYILYDNIQYTKNSWIRRNRILVNGKDFLFTLPIKKESDYLDIKDRHICENSKKEKQKILNIIKNTYKNAPYFNDTFVIIENILKNSDDNLFNYIYYSIMLIKEYLEIPTEIIISSNVDINHELKSQDKVIALCNKMKATEYYNAIGGMELYSYDVFKKNGIVLSFLRTKDDILYKQFNNEFVPNLSIIDVMMFNSKDEIKDMLKQYELISEA